MKVLSLERVDLDLHGSGNYFKWVCGVDVIVEQNTVKMVHFVLQNDGVIPSGGYGDVFHFRGIERLDDDLEVAIDVTWMFFID